MSGREFSTVHYSRTFVFVRGLSFGGVGAALAGAVAGSFFLPGVGTIVGLIYGLVFGLAIGPPCALTLALVAPKVPDAAEAGSVGALIGLAWSAVVVTCFDVMEFNDLFENSLLRTVIVAVVGAVVGAVVAPRATFAREHVLRRAEENPFVAGAP